MTDVATFRYPWRHELANALTHGVGLALSIAGLVMMVVYAANLGDVTKIVSVSVFGASMILLYMSSTLYHGIPIRSAKKYLRAFDHACIFLLIAGTYTPVTLVSLKGGWGWSLFAIAWGLALFGVLFKVFYVDRLEYVSLAVYLGMGWMGLVAAYPVYHALSGAGLLWLALGGLMYTFGVIFYVWRTLPYNHAIWHLFVMAGTACHFVTVYKYVLPVEVAA